eukprot:Opistho-2@90415
MARACLFVGMLAIACFASSASAFYLPGVSPKKFEKGDEIKLLVNRLDSTLTAVPFDFAHFLTCPVRSPDHGENLGQVLLGERIMEAPSYKINFLQNVDCAVACSVSSKGQENGYEENQKRYENLYHGVQKRYIHHWIVDNLPVVQKVHALDPDGKTTDRFRVYFPLGCEGNDHERHLCDTTGMESGKYYLNNHVHLTIEYHNETTGTHIVAIVVEPRSIDHKSETEALCVAEVKALPLLELPPPNKANGFKAVYTYSVSFQPSKTAWHSRWDVYLNTMDAKIHWFSIVNSLIIVLFLSGMVAMILLRSLHRDLARYNQTDLSQEDAQEEFGWKLVHGDVFRAPSFAMLLAVSVGTGVQVLVMTLISLVFACLGFLSPSTRGGLMVCLIVLYILLGTPAGYVSARLYKMFGGEKWKSNVLLTSFFYPGLLFVVFFFLNIVLWSQKSSSAIPISTMIALVFLWFGISVPLCFLGAYLGFRKSAIEHPVRTNQIPRQIPEQVFYMRPLPAILMGSVLPFSAVFIELYFIISSVWFDLFYYLFGFLFLVFVILAVTCSEVSILMCYFQLCAEDYQWWWRSFLTSGFTGLYLYIYSIVYYFTRLEMNGFVSGAIYFGYSFMASLLVFVLTGTIGFLACLFFVRKIYASVKID